MRLNEHTVHTYFGEAEVVRAGRQDLDDVLRLWIEAARWIYVSLGFVLKGTTAGNGWSANIYEKHCDGSWEGID